MNDVVRYAPDLGGVNWAELKGRLGHDNFDNGRTPEELHRSFASSHSTVMAWMGNAVVGTARLLADGICNAYLVDVWTDSRYRRRGIGTAMVERLLSAVPGHHVALFTDEHPGFYKSLGFEIEEVGMSLVVGSWLNRAPPDRRD
jgi:ribosomal protein S18 acetylase RimI-like enzyme